MRSPGWPATTVRGLHSHHAFILADHFVAQLNRLGTLRIPRLTYYKEMPPHALRANEGTAYRFRHLSIGLLSMFASFAFVYIASTRVSQGEWVSRSSIPSFQPWDCWTLKGLAFYPRTRRDRTKVTLGLKGSPKPACQSAEMLRLPPRKEHQQAAVFSLQRAS